MNSNFNCSYMAMSNLTYILGFSVRFFQPVYSVEEYYEIKITSKSFAQKFELKWFSKLCVTPPFSINFRCQIENQVSDYRILGASSWNNYFTCIFHKFYIKERSELYLLENFICCKVSTSWNFYFYSLPMSQLFIAKKSIIHNQ